MRPLLLIVTGIVLATGVAACATLKTAAGEPPSETPADTADGGADAVDPSGDGGSLGDASATPEGNGDPRWPQSRVPADAPATSSYTIENGPNGAIVTDTVTGLAWQDTAPTVLRTFEQASTYCEDLVYGGLDDWRLPTRVEGVSIMSFGDAGQTKLVSAAFSAFDVSCVWTASVDPSARATPRAWTLGAANITTRPKTDRCAARCVRGGPPLGAPAAKVYELTANAVIDPVTRLAWERTPPDATTEHADAESRCHGLALDGRTMRLPSVKELVSIVDETRSGPATAPAFGDYGVRFSTANPRWVVDFDRGDTFQAASGFSYHARCVVSLP
ncbi:MAG: DUF1566 domain-containing protein [Labilithrix sp.]|nr:DUF1566 domain-containing protein [Labilithrix sp.]